jgi:hypothetical protein
LDTSSLPKFCPVCKLANKPDTLVCEFCGTVLVDFEFGDDVTTKNVPIRRATDQPVDPYELPAPQRGISFFLFGKTEPFSTLTDEVIYLGRLDKETTEVVVDLNLLDGFNLGVSRRHAKIQIVDGQYEITDMFSSNGTFLNGQRLLPPKSYPLKSGTVIQLGRLKLIVMHS